MTENRVSRLTLKAAAARIIETQHKEDDEPDLICDDESDLSEDAC